ncbi:hypothetical protein Tco_1458984 [Tanacetum coccineum]
MSARPSFPRRTRRLTHANDILFLTTMRFIPQHKVVQRYGAILPDYLTNLAMKESEAYKTYHDLATRKKTLSLKFSTHDDKARQEEVNKEDSFDPRVQTHSHLNQQKMIDSMRKFKERILRNKRWLKRRHMKRTKRMTYTGT